MTPLNTIIEEENGNLKKYEDIAPSGALIVNAYYETIEHLFTTAIQRAYEAGQSEERAKIRKEVEALWKANAQRTDEYGLGYDAGLDTVLAKFTESDKTNTSQSLVNNK